MTIYHTFLAVPLQPGAPRPPTGYIPADEVMEHPDYPGVVVETAFTEWTYLARCPVDPGSDMIGLRDGRTIIISPDMIDERDRALAIRMARHLRGQP